MPLVALWPVVDEGLQVRDEEWKLRIVQATAGLGALGVCGRQLGVEAGAEVGVAIPEHPDS